MLEKIAPWFIAFIVLSIIAEAWYSFKKQKNLYDIKDTWTSITFGILGIITRLTLKGVNLVLWLFLYSVTPFKIETTALSLCVLFLLNELVYYWFHRLSHEIPFFWATHVNHH